MTPPDRPNIKAPGTPTNPEAGVIVARPATIPVTIPINDGFPNLNHSIAIHDNEPIAAAI